MLILQYFLYIANIYHVIIIIGFFDQTKKEIFFFMLITNEAITYLNKILLGKKIKLRLNIISKKDLQHSLHFSLCRIKDIKASDTILHYNNLKIFISLNDTKILKNSTIDYRDNNKIGGLVIKSNNLKKIYNENLTKMFTRVQNILNKEVNPILKQHDGKIMLVEIVGDNAIKIKFSGNCNSCSMASGTLNNSVKLIIKKFFPKIINIYDVTNHQKQRHPYY